MRTADGRRTVVRAAAVAVWLAIAVECGGGGEYLVLQRFFAASHLRDRTALARFATTIFEPNVDGTVDRFSIVDVGADADVQSGGGENASAPARDQLVQLSLNDPLDPVERSTAEVTLTQRTVAIDADVRRPDGTPSTRRIDVTLVRATVGNPTPRHGRWIVTGFR